MKPVGQLHYFRSDVDGKLHPCAVCATDTTDDPKPLILEVSPGAISNLPGAVSLTEEIAGIAARNGRSCVVLRPTGRGPGSVYQNYGEVDVLEAVEHVAVHGGIAPDAICWGSHLDMDLLPDYLVYSRGELLDWGFWGNDWKSQK